MQHLETFYPRCYVRDMEHEEFKARRRATGLTQAQAAEVLKVSRSAILRWENGDNAPPGILLDLACKQLEHAQRDKEAPTA